MYMYYGGALCINNILAILSFKLKNSCPREMTVYAKHMNIRICIDVDNNTQAFLYLYVHVFLLFMEVHSVSMDFCHPLQHNLHVL